MGRQEEALRVAEELLTDIELKRLTASEVALKAGRVARLVGHPDLTTLLGYERSGYPGDGSAAEWIERTGRQAEEGKYYPASLAQVEARLESSKLAVDALRGGGNYSGDYALVASRNHDTTITSHTQSAAIWAHISGQVVATIYDLVTEIYHELLFSELQATLFADVQTTVDGRLSVIPPGISGGLLSREDETYGSRIEAVLG